MHNKLRISFFGQFGILLGLVGVGIMLAAIFQFAILASVMNLKDMLSGGTDKFMNEMFKPENLNKAKLMQVGGTFLMMFVPIWGYAKICNKQPFSYIGFNRGFSAKNVFIVAAITFLGMLLSGALGEINQLIPIPKNWELKFKKMEADYAMQVAAMATMKTFGQYLIGMLIIAILPAIFEEMLFRGGLQQIFTNWFKNPFWAIVVTSFFFSIIHMSYYGFLPRFFLGIMLGYVFYYTNNLWYCIVAHFINNGIAITAMYWLTQTGRDMQKVMEYNFPVWVGALALLPMIWLFMKLKTNEAKTENYFAEANNTK